MWEEFKSKLQAQIDKWVPFRCKNVGTKKNISWFCRELKTLHTAKQKSFREYKMNGDSISKDHFDRIRRNFKNLARKKKEEFELNIALKAKRDPKSFFAYINSSKAESRKIGPLKDESNKLILDDGDIAQSFNDYFKSVFHPADPADVDFENSERELNNINF